MLDDPIFSEQRLASVLASELLDSGPEESFDFYTRMASRLVEAPFAFMTVVDSTRSFWKSTAGLPSDSPRQNTIEESFCQYVIRTGEKLIVNDSRLNDLTKNNPSVDSMGVLAWAGFPVIAPNNDIIGTFCTVDTKPRVWSQHEIDIIESLALATSREIALRFAILQERYGKRRAQHVIQVLQSSLLPPALPETPGLDVGASFVPAGSGTELVGDFYDIFQNGDESWSFLVGDVCGKGLEAARLATFARHVVSSSAITNTSATRVLQRLNRTLLAKKHEYDQYLTAVFGIVQKHAASYTLRIASAGHVPALIRKADGSIIVVKSRGFVLGIFDDLELEETEFTICAGDAIVLYTDGVTEARNGDAFYGEERLMRLLATVVETTTAQTLTELIQSDVRAFSEGLIRDDIAVVVIKIPQ